MARKPTRRRIRRHAARHRHGGTVYQSDHAMDQLFTDITAPNTPGPNVCDITRSSDITSPVGDTATPPVD